MNEVGFIFKFYISGSAFWQELLEDRVDLDLHT